MGQRTTKPSFSNGGRGITLSNHNGIDFKDLFNAEKFYEITAANIALPKYGLDDGTSASATLQVRFGAGPFSLYLIGKFNFPF